MELDIRRKENYHFAASFFYLFFFFLFLELGCWVDMEDEEVCA